MTTKLAIRNCEEALEKYKPDFAKVLPPGIKPDRIIRSVINSVASTPKLLECDKASLIMGAMTAAVLGLECDAQLGQAYLVPFKGKVQFIPGYKGLITLAQRSNYTIEAAVVREKDEYSQTKGTNPQLIHIPAPGSNEDRGDIVYAYAIATPNVGKSIFKVIHVEEINKIRDKSAGYVAYKRYGRQTTWVTNYEQMCEKTAIRAVASRLPLNVLNVACTLENNYERGVHTYIDETGRPHTDEIKDVSVSSEQPDLKEIVINNNCQLCDGSGVYEAAGQIGDCPECKGENNDTRKD